MKCKLSPVAFDAEFGVCYGERASNRSHQRGFDAHGGFFPDEANGRGVETRLSTATLRARIGLKERFHALQAHRLGPPGNSRQSHWHEVTWGGIIHQIESTNKAAARFGIELRHPFRDRRLMEFCLALPAEQKLHKGLNRMVMRRAMAGIVPDEIMCRGDKVDFHSEHKLFATAVRTRDCGGSDPGAFRSGP